MEQPPLVTKALAFAAARGFATSCQKEDGALLHVLAARRGVMRVGEIGTGAGVGTAWLASALPPTTPLFTTETDPDLAAAVAAFYVDDPNVTILVGSWRDTLPPEAPFDLMFVDASDAKDDVESTIGLLTPGGTAVLDDYWFAPSDRDQRRDAWLRHPLLTAIEVWVTPERRALVAVRR